MSQEQNLSLVIDVMAFWEKVDLSAGPEKCWPWMGGLSANGYGAIVVRKPHKVMMGAHQVSYVLHYGPVPDGLNVCHTCDNRQCVNPAHLFVGTDAENMQDMVRKKRQTIPNRHGELNPCAKLTWDKVDEIRRRYAGGGLSQQMLATEYGVTKTAIRYVLQHRVWNRAG